MLARREFILAGTGLLLSLSMPLLAQARVKEVVGIVHVFGDGARLDTLSIAYDTEVSRVHPHDFKVHGRVVQEVYISQDIWGANHHASGHFVILKLKEAKPLLESIQHHKPQVHPQRKFIAGGKPEHTLKLQIPTILLKIKGRTLGLARVSYPIVEDFRAFVFEDQALQRTLPYHLFTPQSKEKLPLVLFMHDAGVVGNLKRATLLQGLGALIWAHPKEQAKRPCYVLAPQYNEIVVDDNSNASPMLDVTMHLVKELCQKYPIDPSRIYTTGQSMGCMMSIAMLIKYPHFFAGAFLVAGQWKASLCGPLVHDRLWILVSQDDLGAYPAQTAIVEKLEHGGVKVAKAIWDGRWDQAHFMQACKEMMAQNAPINYAVLKKGSLPSGDKMGAHRGTWQVAYNIEPIRAWLFKQTLKNV